MQWSLSRFKWFFTCIYIFCIVFQACYLPWVILGFNYIIGGSYVLTDVTDLKLQRLFQLFLIAEFCSNIKIIGLKSYNWTDPSQCHMVIKINAKRGDVDVRTRECR